MSHDKSILCSLGIHSWESDCSRCSRCGFSRNKQHYWNGCRCSKCYATRENEKHDWDGCLCIKCGRLIPTIREIIEAARGQFECVEKDYTKVNETNDIIFRCKKTHEGFKEHNLIFNKSNGLVEWYGDPNFASELSIYELFEWHSRLTVKIKQELGDEWNYNESIDSKRRHFIATSKDNLIKISVFLMILDGCSPISNIMISNTLRLSSLIKSLYLPIDDPRVFDFFSSVIDELIRYLTDAHTWGYVNKWPLHTEYPQRERIRKLGESINDNYGFDAMQKVAIFIIERNENLSSHLQQFWHGIGQWLA